MRVSASSRTSFEFDTNLVIYFCTISELRCERVLAPGDGNEAPVLDGGLGQLDRGLFHDIHALLEREPLQHTTMGVAGMGSQTVRSIMIKSLPDNLLLIPKSCTPTFHQLVQSHTALGK